jgi:hypothetical protein
MVALVVRTFENGRLVLEHQFFGATKRQALAIYGAHLKTDSFLRAASTVQNWHGIPLKNESHWTAL